MLFELKSEIKLDFSILDESERYLKMYKKLIKVSQTAEKNYQKNGVRTIILADEIDSYTTSTSPIAPHFKFYLENCAKKYHVTIIGTTNHPILIDESIRNAKRMPLKLGIDPPNKENAQKVLKYYLSLIPAKKYCEEINLDELTDALLSNGNTCSNSTIANICRKLNETTDIITQKKILKSIEQENNFAKINDINEYYKEKKMLEIR